jgi:predicted dehydrogenase
MTTGNRRAFLSSMMAASAMRVLGANDRINVAVIGIGGRGRDHINFTAMQPGAHIAAVCDVNQAAQERAVAMVEKLQGHKPAVFSDMRKLFEDKSIDAVTMATPNHWHALGTVWACQAGKDVYVEKPACHNVFEGRKMIEAARKYRRMVQVGSQSRSNQHKIEAMRLLAEGVIGKLYLAKGLCYKRRKSIGHTPDQPVPPGVDWDLFLGPAPMRPFSQNRFAYNWHWFWDTGNGDIGNQGVHEMDIARWGLGEITFPKSVVSTGGKFLYEDDQETPNTQSATLDYGNGMQIVFEVRGLITNAEEGVMIGNIFYGSDGFMTIDAAGYKVYRGEEKKLVMEQNHKEPRQYDPAPHFASFLKAVRSRKVEDLTADVERGVISASLCHLANISYRLGRKLNVDAASWSFAGDAEANRMLTRDYRKPYVVPESV